jgi:hypothetical protein
MRYRPQLIVVSLFVLLAAGCGGSGTSSPPVTTTTRQTRALAFAQCMRAHGLAGFPDPNSSGDFDKSKLRQLGYPVAQIRAVQDGACKHLLPSRPQGPAITQADRVAYLKAAACMRSHGYSNFPDPTFKNNNVRANIPSSINQDSPQFKNVATTCTKLIPAGLPYSSAQR